MDLSGLEWSVSFGDVGNEAMLLEWSGVYQLVM